MSIKVNISATNEAIRELLQAIVECMHKTMQKQRVEMVLELTFKESKKRDC